MNAEIKLLSEHRTWEIVYLNPGKKMIDCRYMFKVELNAEGSINSFKGRIVAQGFKQEF